jgi:hypothetical protein
LSRNFQENVLGEVEQKSEEDIVVDASVVAEWARTELSSPDFDDQGEEIVDSPEISSLSTPAATRHSISSLPSPVANHDLIVEEPIFVELDVSVDFRTPLIQFSEQQVGFCLHAFGMAQHVKPFLDNRVDGATLLECSSVEDLTALGMGIPAHATFFLTRFQQMKRRVHGVEIVMVPNGVLEAGELRARYHELVEAVAHLIATCKRMQHEMTISKISYSNQEFESDAGPTPTTLPELRRAVGAREDKVKALLMALEQMRVQMMNSRQHM